MSIMNKYITVNVDKMQATLTIYDGETETKSAVPCRFEICPHCSGFGKSSSYLGAFTGSEWRDLDDDFKEDYLAGRLDRPCEHCPEFPGRVVVPDIRALSKRDRQRWNQQVRDEHDYQRMCEAERRMGA